jgi:acyl carrier protein
LIQHAGVALSPGIATAAVETLIRSPGITYQATRHVGDFNRIQKDRHLGQRKGDLGNKCLANENIKVTVEFKITVEPTRKKIRDILSVRLKLSTAVAKWGDDDPLFGVNGLGLDSIDALELVLGLQKEFGVVIETKEEAVKVLFTINTIAEFVHSQGKE